MRDSALILRDVHAHYGLSHVLQGVSLTVGAHEVVGLFGRNGVGKTTIIKTVAGWVTPTSGELRFAGASIANVASDVICRRGVGLVPEDRRIFPGLTVEENIKLGLAQCPARSRSESQKKIDATYARFPRLAERRKQQGTTLSGGEQQMLAIARVLVGEPKLLLIDEPTEGLAPIIVDEIFALMTTLRREGIPILLVEQNARRAAKLVDRFYVIERGVATFEGRSDRPDDVAGLFQRIAV